MKKAIYHIGCGELSRPVFDWAHEEELTVIASDRSTDPGGRNKVDHLVTCDALDLSEHTLQILKYQKDYDIVGVVYSTDERACVTAAALSEKFNLPGHSLEAVAAGLSKGWQALTLKRNGVSHPTTQNFTGKHVVKPTNSEGSQDVHVFEGGYVLQEFVEGKHFNLNGVMIRGLFFEAGVEQKWNSGTLPVFAVNPPPTPPDLYEAWDLFSRAVHAMNWLHGPVKADMILTPEGKWYVLEVTPRFHGEVWTTWSGPLGTGINPWKFYLHWLATEEIDSSYLEPRVGTWAYWKVIDTELPKDAPEMIGGQLALDWVKNPDAQPPFVDAAGFSGYAVFASPNREVSPEFLSRHRKVTA